MKSEKAATRSPCLNQRFHASNFRQHEYDAGATCKLAMSTEGK